MGKKKFILSILLVALVGVTAVLSGSHEPEDPPGVGTNTTISYLTC